ncbi:hypothetical protein Tco_1283682 [Tanacetum coccineum]
MESIRRNFFNGVENAEKKMLLIGWNKILASKKNGGLGALLFKWIWQFLANGASLWSRFISAIYGIRGSLDNSSSYSRRSPWLDIVNEVRKLASKGIDLLLLVKKKGRNGLDKHVSVVSKLRANSLISSFWRSPQSGIEEEQLLLLISNTSSVILANISDRWSWLLDPSDDFLVKSTREFIDDSMLPKTDLMIKVVHWLDFEYQDFHSYEDWLLWFKNPRVSKRLKDVFEGVCYISCLMEQGSVPLPITQEAILRLNNGFTKEVVLRLNNGLVTFEQARALFNVDLSTFKARLVQLNIFVWNEVNGPVKTYRDWHFAVEFSKERGYLVYMDLEICPSITIFIKERQNHNVVHATKPFETVKTMIEADLSLCPGCYKLTYNLPPNGDVWVKTDRDWHFIVQFSKERGYFVYLDLEICPSGTTTHLAFEDSSREMMLM